MAHSDYALADRAIVRDRLEPAYQDVSLEHRETRDVALEDGVEPRRGPVAPGYDVGRASEVAGDEGCAVGGHIDVEVGKKGSGEVGNRWRCVDFNDSYRRRESRCMRASIGWDGSFARARL